MINNEIIELAQRLYNFARELNYTHKSAIGVCANVMAESSFNEGASEIGGLGFGLGQWTPIDNLFSQGAMLGYTTEQCLTFDVQCDILLRGQETGQWSDVAYDYDPLVISPQTLREFKRSDNIFSATMNYMAHWERPNEDPEINHKERRKQYAVEFDEKLNGGGGGVYPHLPVDIGVPITSPYGMRIDPISWEEDFHAGLDFSNGLLNSPIYATMTGIVQYAGFNEGGLGNVIWIQHTSDSYYSAYAHLETILVQTGDTVSMGQRIGGMGTTGYSTGIHLHFVVATELWGNNETNTIDPEIYLDTSYIPEEPDNTKPNKRKKELNFWILENLKKPF